MDHALRMNHDFDVLVGKPEQEMRFDYLERFVGERRAVDGDLAPHTPGWMAQRIIDRRCRESLNGPVAEWPSRSGQHDSTNLRRRMSGNALENRAVLAVDRDDFAKPLSARVSYQITRDNESLLVGERDTLSSLQRSKRGVQSSRTDDCVDHDIDVIAGSRGNQRLSSALPGFVCIRLRFHHSDEGR